MFLIKRPLYTAMLLHTRLLYPQEACGFLAGSGGVLHALYAIENRLPGRAAHTAYEMQPGQQIEAMLEIEDAGWETLIIYHSHPQGPLHPSPTDLEKAFYPEAVYAILAFPLAQPRLTLYTIREGRYWKRPWQIV